MFRKALIIFFILCCASTVNAQKITLAYVDFPPYEFVEDNRPSGILVEIVETLFKRANISLELKFLPFKRAYRDAKSGAINGLFNFYKIEERLKYFDYSGPIIENPLVLFVRRDTEIQFEKLEDLKGLHIGAMRGYTYGTDFDTSTLFTIDRANSHVSNFTKLLYGRIDAYPCDKLVGIHVARKQHFMSEFRILPKPLMIMDGHIGFTKGKHRDVIARINKEITLMLQNNEITEVINQFLEKEAR